MDAHERRECPFGLTCFSCGLRGHRAQASFVELRHDWTQGIADIIRTVLLPHPRRLGVMAANGVETEIIRIMFVEP